MPNLALHHDWHERQILSMYWTCANAGTCRASSQGRPPLDIILGASTSSALSGFGCQTRLHRPRHRTEDPVRRSTRGVRARLHDADDLQLLGGREVRHHRRLLSTRENQAFLEDGQPNHAQSCKRRQNNSHGGSATTVALLTPPYTPARYPSATPARRLPTIVPPVTFTVGPMENLLSFTDCLSLHRLQPNGPRSATWELLHVLLRTTLGTLACRRQVEPTLQLG